jgi:hypothetical protein
MSRVTDNWLHTFLEWTVDRSESPESMILWSGLCTLASVLKRHVRVPKKLMGGYDIYPNLFVIFVAPPAVARKSTTVGRAEDLLRDLDGIAIGSTAVSASKLISDMSDTLDGSITLLPSELGTFMNVSQEEMYDVLTDLYDNKKIYTYSTRTHGLEIVENPCVNFLAATTPKWVEQQMPIHVIGGGFASRVIFIFEDAPRTRQLYYDIDPSHYKRLEEALVHDLRYIQKEVKGDFKHDNTRTRDFVESWYRDNADNFDLESGPGVEGYQNRKHIHLHKVAMLLSIAESDALILRREHFEQALVILGAIEENMSHALVYAGQNPLAEATWQVWDFITKSGGIADDRSIVKKFHIDLGSDGISEVLATLVRAGVIERVLNHSGQGKHAYKNTGLTL